MVVRNVSLRCPSFLLRCLLTGMALSPLLVTLPGQAEETVTPAHTLTTPRTLKEAGIAPAEIVGQTSESPIIEDLVSPISPLEQRSFTKALYPPIPVRGGASFTSGPGVGYESSFFGLEGFVPITQTPGKNLTFAQGRLLLDTNGGNPGGNFLLGYRDFDPGSGRILGGHVGVDVRDTGRTTFSQLGAGVEAVFPSFEFRVNGYLPVGDRRREVDSQTFSNTTSSSTTSTSLSGGTTTPTNIRFQGNNLLFDLPAASTLTTTTTTRNQTTRFTRALDEVSLGGLDAEAGMKIAQLGRGSDLRSYLGLYYYSGEGVSGFLGVRGRLALRINDTVTAGFAVQGDREFGTTAVATFSLQFPNVSRKTTGQPGDNWARMGDSVTRNPAVAVTERTRTSTSTQVTETVQTSTQPIGAATGITALNPATGQPWVFQHVVLGGAAGTGTFENPFATIAAGITAAPGSTGNDIVYVQAGTNPGIGAFTIKDGVQVLSSGVVQSLATVQGGTLQLPLSGSGTLPRVVGTVTMGNNTTLGGFNITGFTGIGIVGTGLRNGTIQDNVITNLSGANGIDFGGNLTGALTIRRNSIGTGIGTAINLAPNQATASPLTIDISSNTVQNTLGRGLNFGTFGNTQTTAIIADNTFTNVTGFGLVAFAVNSSQLRVTVNNNQVVNMQDDGFGRRVGISVESFNTAQLFASMTNNRVANSNTFGGFDRVEYKAQIATGPAPSACVRFLNNTASNSGYLMNNSVGAAILRLEPFTGNTGTRQPDLGTITNVAIGFCGF